MVFQPVPKYVKKGTVKKSKPFAFRAQDKREDRVATVATCMRCAQGIATQKKNCDMPDHRRCEHCVKGNRGNCAAVPSKLVGRVNRLYELRTLYAAAVTAAATPRTDEAVQKTGVKLARAQRQFNLELSHHRRTAAHTGTPVGVPTQVPTTTPQFLSLILVEQRRIAASLEKIARHAGTIADNDDDDDDGGNNDDPEEDSGDDRTRQAATGATDGRGDGAGGANGGNPGQGGEGGDVVVAGPS